MKQLFNVAAIICVLALAACTKPFKKAKDGSEYKIISVKKGAKVITGNIMEMAVSAKYKDSVLFSSTEDGTAQFAMYDTANFPVPYKEIFKNIHIGDSIVLRVSTDSIIKKGGAQPFMKKGEYIYQFYVITNAYTSKEQVDSVQKIYAASKHVKDSIFAIKQLVTDSKTIEDYMAKNKITATKTAKGTYVQVLEPGAGDAFTDSSVVLVNYTGRLFNGEVFDSNTDSSFQHVEPFPINFKNPGVIIGWVDGLKQLKKGSKAKFLIPSSLAWGKEGFGEKIKANVNVVFDINVVDVITQAQFMEMMKKKQEEQMAQQKMMQQMQQQMQQQQGGAPNQK